MDVQATTQCRLCGGRFTEYLEVNQAGDTYSVNPGHPFEDGNAWCSPCKDKLDRVLNTIWRSPAPA